MGLFDNVKRWLNKDQAPQPSGAERRVHERFQIHIQKLTKVEIDGRAKAELEDLSQSGARVRLLPGSIGDWSEMPEDSTLVITTLDQSFAIAARKMHVRGEFAGYQFSDKSAEAVVQLFRILACLESGAAMKPTGVEGSSRRFASDKGDALSIDTDGELCVDMTFDDGVVVCEVRVQGARVTTRGRPRGEGVFIATNRVEKMMVRQAIYLLSALDDEALRPAVQQAIATLAAALSLGKLERAG